MEQLQKIGIQLTDEQLLQLNQLKIQQTQVQNDIPPRIQYHFDPPVYETSRKFPKWKPQFSLDPNAIRPMMQGFTKNCERAVLRQLQKEKFFDDDDILHPKPIYISPIEGSEVRFENIPKKVTKEDFSSTLEKCGPIKQIVVSTSGQSAIVTMVKREDAKKLGK